MTHMIGLKRNTVQLCPYDPTWKIQGEATVQKLRKILGETAVDVRHVGSTAIVGMTAKPIIDIAVAVRELADILPYFPRLEEEGFIHRPKNDNESQYFLICGNLEEDVVTHHIHVVQAEGMPWRNYVNFVAYLTAFPEKAAQYAAKKRELSVRFAADRVSYTEGKAELIGYLLRKAMVWSYLGKTVTVEIDRPIGYVHHKEKYDLQYPINYGFIPGVLGGDGEELDVYVLGEERPCQSCNGSIIGIAHRENDVEDKLILSADGKHYTAQQMLDAISFQEKYYRTTVESKDGSKAKIF